MIVIVSFIERNSHEESGAGMFLYSLIIVALGMIGASSGGIGELIIYVYLFTVVGGYLASDYLFDYDFKRKMVLVLAAPTALIACWIVGEYFEKWFLYTLMK